MKTTLITGGEPHYQLGLVSGLAEQPVDLDVIGSEALMSAPVMVSPRLRYHRLRSELDSSGPARSKLSKVLGYYARLIRYAATTDSRLFHLQWPYKFPVFDRTALNVWFKLFRRRIVFTAHNVDQEMRDGSPSWKNRLSLWFLYRIVDHIIVHTALMKEQLVGRFGVPAAKVTVIPHGINSSAPETAMTRDEARAELKLDPGARVLLFFGLIDRYKGLEYLVDALGRLRRSGQDIRLVVAGRVKECPEYWNQIHRQIADAGLEDRVTTHLRRIPDEQLEIYFKAADALVMPYRSIFQSGVLFLAYRFGLPVIATDVGSLREDIVEGRTGFLCRPEDPEDLARVIAAYFEGDFRRELAARRVEIRNYAREKYSWSRIGAMTCQVYRAILGESLAPGLERTSDTRVGRSRS